MDGYLGSVLRHSCPVIYKPWARLLLNLGCSWDECPIGTLLATALAEHCKLGSNMTYCDFCGNKNCHVQCEYCGKVNFCISDTCRDTDTLGSSHSSNKDRIGMVGAGPSLPLHSFTTTTLSSSSRCQAVVGTE